MTVCLSPLAMVQAEIGGGAPDESFGGQFHVDTDCKMILSFDQLHVKVCLLSQAIFPARVSKLSDYCTAVDGSERHNRHSSATT
jgi:hypothetical protein